MSASPAAAREAPCLAAIEAEALRILSDPSTDLAQVTVRTLRQEMERALGVPLSATAEQKEAVKVVFLRAFEKAQSVSEGSPSRAAAAPHPDEPKPKKRRKRRSKAEIEQGRVQETVSSLIAQVERMHRQEAAGQSEPKRRKRRTKAEIEQGRVRDTVNALISQVERMARQERSAEEKRRRQELKAEEKRRNRQQADEARARAQALRAEEKRRAKQAAEEAQVRGVVHSWLCGARNGLIAKIERAQAQALVVAERERKRQGRLEAQQEQQDRFEVRSVVDGLIKKLERAKAQDAHTFEQVRAWLCGSRSGLIAQLERQHEQAEAVVQNLFYAPRSGLIARLEREARDAAEESFRSAEVERLLQRSTQSQGRDSLGVFTAPQSPDDAEADADGASVRFWWAKLQCIKKAVVRRTYSLSSEKIGVVKKRRVIQVVAFAEVDDVQRVQLARGVDGAPGGWLSIKSSAGNVLLEQIDEGRNNPPPVKVHRLTIAEKWAEEEKVQREAHLTELENELRQLSLEQLQRRAMRENIGVSRLMAVLQRERWGEDVKTPKQAMIAMLLEAEEVKLDAPIVSSYRGVWWSRNSHKWQAAIQYRGTKDMLGCFETEELAAKAYDTVARREHGKSAQLNFPLPGERQGKKHRTWTEEDLRRRQETRLAKQAEEAARKQKFERKLEKLKKRLLKLDVAVLKDKALREGLLPQRVEAAATPTNGTEGDGAAKEALAQLLLAVERKREEERLADQRALELMEAAEQRRLKAGNKTEIIVACDPEDNPPEDNAKWRLMPSDVAHARRRQIAALSQDDEVERKKALAALRARQRKQEEAERERIERARRARRASLPISDRRSLHRDEGEMRALLEPKALRTAGPEHFARIKRLLGFFEEFDVTKPALISLAKEVLIAKGVLPKQAPRKVEQEIVDEWVQCEDPECRKWRLLPKRLRASDLNIAVFTCPRNFWNPAEASCSVPQQDSAKQDTAADASSELNASASKDMPAANTTSSSTCRSRDDDADALRLQKRRKLAVGDRRRLEQDEAKMRALLAEGADGDFSAGRMGNFAICRRWIEAKAELVDPSLLQDMRGFHAQVERAQARAEAAASYKKLKAEALALKRAGRREEAKAKLREMNKLKPQLTQ